MLAHLEVDDFPEPLVWGSKCWGTTTASGREYALFCGRLGTAVVEVTDPGRPMTLAVIPGPASSNRSARVYGGFGYVTANGGGGIQVLDLRLLDQGLAFESSVVLAGGAPATHNLALDATSGFLYRLGFESGFSPSMRIYDLVDPANPLYVGSWDPPGDHPGAVLVHDAEVITYTSGPFAGRQIAYTCTTGEAEALSIVDVTDKAAPFLMQEVHYPNPGLSHQVVLSEDRQWAFFNDEFDELGPGVPTTTHIFDVSDIENVSYTTSFTNGNNAVSHDAFVKGNRLYAANYTSGMRVFDISNPLNAFEVASFDTWFCNDQSTFDSLYAVYAGLPSGTVIGSAIQNGFFVWRMGPPYLKLDFVDGGPQLLAPSGQTVEVTIAEADGQTLEPGSAELWFETQGTRQAVPLVDLGTGTFRATLPALPVGELIGLFASARSADGTSWTQPPAAFTRQERIWATAANAKSLIFADDFESDLGWSINAVPVIRGQWERATPDGTPYAPAADATPGAGTQCWVTDDVPSPCEVLPGEVAGGPYILTSPEIDLSGASDPWVRYARWFSNLGGAVRNDALLVQVSRDGSEWTTVETVGPDLPGTAGGWLPHQFRVLDFAALTSTFQLRFLVSDTADDSVVEAGVDDFEVFEVSSEVATSYCTAKLNSCGSLPAIGFTGTPSATSGSGFAVECSNVPGGTSGILLYSALGRANPPTPFQGGLLCINKPFKRGGITMELTGTPGLCDGFLSYDMNAVATGMGSTATLPALTLVGSRITCQFWARDTPTSSMISDALEYVVGP